MQIVTHTLFLRALILLGLIVFGFVLGIQYGFLDRLLAADRSYLASVILVTYLLATAHWLWIAWLLSLESSQLARYDADQSAVPSGLVGELLQKLDSLRDDSQAALLEAYGDTLSNRHALGHFLSDVLLRLGLLGTIVGFILMLIPVAEAPEFDSAVMQRLLVAMSGGMAVALYTTLVGLIGSTLLRLQYHLLDAAVAAMSTRLAMHIHANAHSNAHANASSQR